VGASGSGKSSFLNSFIMANNLSEERKEPNSASMSP
jgi:ABC-type lipoprotein export system ATPase subunit